MKIHGEVYGCSASLNDYEIMKGLLENEGFEFVNSVEDSDINLITTCVVKSPTENKMIFRIKELEKTQKPLVIAGCLPKSNPEKIRKVAPDASLIGPNSIEKIVDVIRITLQGKRIEELSDSKIPKVGIAKSSSSPVISTIQILSGCLSFCSFCATKLARGNLYSYPLNAVVNEVRAAKNSGFKEIWLTSQDNSCYGLENGSNLAVLLNQINRIDGKFFVRVGMMNPLHLRKFLPELIETYKSEKIFKFLHLCVQSGSNKILEDMRRGYTTEDFVNYVAEFRKEIPQLTLETDVIVGFSTETDEDFQKTVELMKKIKPDMVNVSRYGVRPGTESAKMKQLDPKIVNSRSKEMFELTRKISLENNKQWIGWKGSVIVDQKVKDFVVARNFAYKSVVIKENIPLGKIVDVEILHADKHSIFAQTV